jgi:hypothetical protein
MLLNHDKYFEAYKIFGGKNPTGILRHENKIKYL